MVGGVGEVVQERSRRGVATGDGVKNTHGQLLKPCDEGLVFGLGSAVCEVLRKLLQSGLQQTVDGTQEQGMRCSIRVH